MKSLSIAAAAMLAVLPLAAPAQAAVIFTDNFNSYANGGATSAQAGTGLTVQAFGDLAGWTKSGVNSLHAVNRNGASDWGLMLFGSHNASPGNAILMNSAIAANSLGVNYSVDFEGAAASYNNGAQGNQNGDVLLFEMLNGVNAVVASYVYDPANWTGAANNPFTAGGFSYVGNGTGDVRLRIIAQSAPGRFGGAIDNLSISGEDPAPVSEPAMLALFGLGALGLGLRRRRK
ncbi:PEP-CTERM sorting domain-containing protein [Sphingoaurantiacus capsulatus]|uniref:PEP-CTERM sorting domain-containing protein n=1 Tax=Sphingoaurantiacus capsulatus TaxID=1771310 RepID=A0ABV7X6V2_9SPHN